MVGENGLVVCVIALHLVVNFHATLTLYTDPQQKEESKWLDVMINNRSID